MEIVIQREKRYDQMKKEMLLLFKPYFFINRLKQSTKYCSFTSMLALTIMRLTQV